MGPLQRGGGVDPGDLGRRGSGRQGLRLQGSTGSIHRGFRLHYNDIDKVFELWFTDETSKTIVAEIRERLLDLTEKGESFAWRHIDFEAFDNIAPLLDWRKLLGLRPP